MKSSPLIHCKLCLCSVLMVTKGSRVIASGVKTNEALVDWEAATNRSCLVTWYVRLLHGGKTQLMVVGHSLAQHKNGPRNSSGGSDSEELCFLLGSMAPSWLNTSTFMSCWGGFVFAQWSGAQQAPIDPFLVEKCWHMHCTKPLLDCSTRFKKDALIRLCFVTDSNC